MNYSGKIKDVIFSNKGWAAIWVELDDSKGNIKAVGDILNPVAGNLIEFTGEEEIGSYGKQIKVTKSKVIRSNTKAGIIAYLTSGMMKGIGPRTAEAMYDKYGDDTINILRKDKNKLLGFKGITPEKADLIYESLQQNLLFEDICKFCGQITTNQANKIISAYGENSVKKLKENPYNLIYDIHGFGFKKVDALALSIGVKEESKGRIGAAIVFLLQTLANDEGHCYATVDYIQHEAIKLIMPIPDGIVAPKFTNKLFEMMCDSADDWENQKAKVIKKYKISEDDEKILDAWVEKRERILGSMAEVLLTEHKAKHIYIENDERIYEYKMYIAECNTANKIVNLLKGHSVKNISRSTIFEGIKNAEEESGYELGDEQKDAILMGLTSRISIITGGPGRGKTTIIKTILDIWDDDSNVVLCAPTGRAAQRMKESTERNADTVHRTITYDSPTGKLIIIDESSMIDISLASNILNWATEGDNNIIFVGDIDQLPSIGPGSFFRDMISSKVIPTTFLKQGYRNEGSIAKNAERINSGQTLKTLVKDDHFIFKSTLKENIQEEIKKTYLELRKKYDEKDICILTPMKQRSRSGSDVLNNMIRNIVNPFNKSNPKLENCDFRLGDRVMATKNMARKEVRKDGIRQLGVYNGDCGKIIDISPEDESLTVEFDDGRCAVFYKNETENFTLAYAMTVHKAQGSEYPAVIIANSKEHFIMLQRNLLYTAETRAKGIVVIIGDPYAITMAVNNTDYKERNTRLKARIIENLKK